MYKRQALLCTAALAGSALALRVVPGGRVLALLFCSPGAAFTLWQQAGVEPPQAQPAAALAESSESPPQPTPVSYTHLFNFYFVLFQVPRQCHDGGEDGEGSGFTAEDAGCLLYTSPNSRMVSI